MIAIKEFNEQEQKLVRACDTKIGDLMIIRDTSYSYNEELCLRVFENIVSLTNPENVWGDQLNVLVEVLPPGSKFIIEVI